MRRQLDVCIRLIPADIGGSYDWSVTMTRPALEFQGHGSTVLEASTQAAEVASSLLVREGMRGL